MAYTHSGSVGLNGSGNLTPDFSAVANGSVIYVLVVGRGSLEANFTAPGGWTQLGATGFWRTADGSALIGRLWLLRRVKQSGDDDTPDFPLSNANDHVLVWAAFSGRDTSTPETFATLTEESSSDTDADFAGGTAAAGDDIIVLTGGPNTTYTTPTNFTERVDFTQMASTSGTIHTRDNVSAGATGTIVVGTATTERLAGFVVAVKAAASAGTVGGSPLSTAYPGGGTLGSKALSTAVGGSTLGAQNLSDPFPT